MSVFGLKVIAIVTMVIDHVGLYFFPQVLVFRMIGRLAFPLFAYLIANGAVHTHNIKNYFLRLFVFAFISQVPYYLVNKISGAENWGLNIFFTLAGGLLVIISINKFRNFFNWLPILVLTMFIARTFSFDYGMMGILSIVAFYIFREKFLFLFITQALLFLSPYIFFFLGFFGKDLSTLGLVNIVQPLALLSLLFIDIYNQERGIGIKYFFYIFYPIQYLIFYLLLLFKSV